MNGGDTIGMAWANLARRKGRTLLTAAGVVVGVASLVLMISLGLGLQLQVLKFFETDEALRTLTVHREKGVDGNKKKSSTPFGFGLGGQMMPITDKDIEEIRKIPGVASARAELNMILRVEVEGEKGSIPYGVEGIVPDEEGRYAKHLVGGAMWADRNGRGCLVPKSFLENRLNLKIDQAVGRKVTFSGFLQEESESTDEDVYTIAGIVDDQKLGLKGRTILLPMEPALKLRERKAISPLLPSKRGSYLSAEVYLTDPRQAEAVAKRLRNSGFATFSTVEIIKSVNVLFLVLECFMGAIGAIGLVVSLFGIANTMAMAVLERTREIGIMKALGARNRDIGRLFLAEAGMIGGLGGLAGLAGGALVGKALNGIGHVAFELPADVSLFHVSPTLALGSVVFAVVVSVVAGWLPARRAARMEPVAAVRYE